MHDNVERLISAGLSRCRKAVNYPYYCWYALRNPRVRKIRKLVRIFDYSRAILRFVEAMAESDLLTDCPLNQDSIVLDVGGFTGEWAGQIHERYQPRLYIFEPNARCFRKLQEKFGNDDKVVCCQYGLAGRDSRALLRIANMGSSIYASSPANDFHRQTSEIVLRDVCQVIEELQLEQIDLIKINIEGGEYELLDRMLATGVHLKCRRIRVQFHEWFPQAHRLRRRVRLQLEASHELEWDYPFVWESWRRKEAAEGRQAA